MTIPASVSFWDNSWVLISIRSLVPLHANFDGAFNPAERLPLISWAFPLRSLRGPSTCPTPDRTYKLGNTSLVFEHTALKEAGFKLRESGLIVQALKSLGSERITPEIISKIRAWLPESLRKKVLADTKTATGWVYAAIQQITQEEPHG